MGGVIGRSWDAGLGACRLDRGLGQGAGQVAVHSGPMSPGNPGLADLPLRVRRARGTPAMDHIHAVLTPWGRRQGRVKISSILAFTPPRIPGCDEPQVEETVTKHDCDAAHGWPVHHPTPG